MQASKKGPMTRAEAERFLRFSHRLRWIGLAAAVGGLPAVLTMWSDSGRTWGLITLGVLALVALDFGIYVPWVFARIVGKRGIAE